MKKALILLAGGKGKRFNNRKKSTPKQFIKIKNYNLIEYFLNNLDEKLFNKIQIVVKKSAQKKYLQNLKKKFPMHNIGFVNSGITRQESSKKGLLSLKNYNPSKVLIHDVARPLTSNKLMKKLIKYLNNNIACSPFIIHNDLIKYSKKEFKNVNYKIINIQTPQAFRYKTILKAHQISKYKDYKDDTSLIESTGLKTKFINAGFSASVD